MKIIKHGEIYKFVCSDCGCAWRAGKNEIESSDMVKGMSCPDCGRFTKGREMFPDKKEELTK